jgi:Kdo2-lipid IVA lauroyltransferase/acyltransferase
MCGEAAARLGVDRSSPSRDTSAAMEGDANLAARLTTRLRWRLEYLIFGFIACLLQMLTARQSAALAELIASLVMRLPKRWTRYHIARENLERAFGPRDAGEGHEPGIPHRASRIPDPDSIIRGMWVHLFRVIAEIVQLPRKLSLTNCRQVIVFRNRKVVMQACCSGRPVIVLGGHFGNWEISVSQFGLFGMRMGIVGRELDNPLLHNWFARFRQATGHRLYLKKGASDEMVQLLEAGGNLALACDQDAGPKGMFVDFFGHPASTFKSIALMALQYDAIIIVGYGMRLPDDFENSRWSRFEIGCEAVIDPRTVDAADPIREITQQYTLALQRIVARCPEQYFWVHRRWKTPPELRRQMRARRKARLAKKAA